MLGAQWGLVAGVKQGGGGDNLKAKAKRIEKAEKESAEKGKNHPGMQWSVGMYIFCDVSYIIPFPKIHTSNI